MAESLSAFSTALASQPESFLTPDLPLHTDILAYIKNLLDPIASDVSTVQQMRLQDARKKRKRGDAPVSEQGVLRLKQLYVNNVSIEQVWEQARRIIDATRNEADLVVAQAQEQDEEINDIDEEEEEEEEVFTDDGDVIMDEEYFHTEDEDEDGEIDEEDENLDSDGEITNEALNDDDLGLDSEDAEDGEQAQELVQDKFGLNDGFFSIDDFNRQSEFLEQQDARGDDDGAASDEEDVDWDADPLSQAASAPAPNKPDDEDEASEEGGPTFGDPDAPSEDEDEEAVGDGDLDMGGLGNTNTVMYTDFFAPPAQKKSKKKKGRPNPHNFPAKTAVQEDDVERTIAAVQRDLFEDEDEDDVEDDAETEMDPGDPRSRRSTHERRKAAIAEEIRKLEAANVAKRQWTLSGEAKASDRPVNSLLEEDLDFERAGKPVPVITAEVSESIEELIKRRILAHDFQDIPRRRPDDLATGKDGRRGRLDFNLDDTKSKKGLAEEYEEEHLRQTDPNFVELKDEKLAKEQKEIEGLWRDVCSKLDSLSSWHFKPRQPVTQLDIKVDAPTITMEDARPNVGGDVAASQLAPQEIYKAGESSKQDNEEVAGKSGLPARREELSREEKKRRRRREKERIHKANGNEPLTSNESKKTKEKKQVVGDLKKGGVKVIGKKGQVTDLAGNADAGSKVQGINAARLKL